MEFFSSLGSMISSGLSSAVSWCSEKFSTLIETGKVAISAIAGTAGSLMKSFGFFKEEETIESIGDRALQAQESKNISPSEFKNMDEYMDSLRNFDLDLTKSEETPIKHKQLKGLEIAGRLLEEKFNYSEGSMSELWTLAGLDPQYFDANRLQTLLKKDFNINEVLQYFEGDLAPVASRNTKNQLIELDMELNPNQTENESRDKLSQLFTSSINILNPEDTK